MAEANAVVVTRVFNAPVERVWQAWSNPELMAKWWGPKDFTAPTIKQDFHEGGKYLYAMHGPAGTEFDVDMWSGGTYKEIVPMKKIVCSDHFADAEGNAVPPEAYGMKGLAEEMLVTIEFEPVEEGKTKLTITHIGAPTGSEHAKNMEQGWYQSLDKLAATL